ncbi:MAG TPA: UvrD-helicase domain-containing protein [Gammaproteobacteria bacterium]|nr:UvrD-helicase domain-containing protein [Gammaproteobacteria bacterium]
MQTNTIADVKERALALNPHASFIVQAPAGSGKTELLIQRYLTLLSHVNSPEEIIAITFTKKAASEMRARIMHALQFAASHPMPETPHQQKTWQLATLALKRNEERGWCLLENASQCRILTIDALCAYFTGQLPLLSHFGAAPSLAEDPSPFYQAAALEVIKTIESETPWTNDVKTLLQHLDNDLNKLLRLLTNMLAKRDQWQPYLSYRNIDGEARTRLESYLNIIVQEGLAHADAVFPASLKNTLCTVMRFGAAQLKLKQIKSPIADCECLTAFPEAHPSQLSTWQAIAEFLLTKSEGKWRARFDKNTGFPALDSLSKTEKPEHQHMRDTLKTMMQTLAEHEACRLALVSITELPDPHYTDEQWKVLSALLNTLTILSAQLTVTFRQHGQIDFIENAQAALTSLGTPTEPTDLALLLDYQIKHILMDEFQDTSFTQYRLAEMLTLEWQPGDGRTLFIVGDPMQSIYRFRQAEVGLFLRMQTHGINQVALNPLQLSVNFRSTQTIVDWNNAMFKHIFPKDHDVATGAVSYHASSAFSNENAPQKTHVQVHALKDAPAHAQAFELANTVQTLLNAHPEDTIAILVKSRSHLSDVLPALKTLNIHFQALDIDPLLENPLIQDLFSLTRALLHPADRIAWLALLRSPWCGLSLNDLHAIAGESERNLIQERGNNPAVLAQLSEDGHRRVSHLMRVMTTARYERERLGLRASVEAAWKALNGDTCLQSNDEQETANTYFECLEAVQLETQQASIALLQKKLNRLYANRQDTEARVHIMTIHTSKGLEYDSVIIPHLEKRNKSDDAALLLWMERTSDYQDGLLLLAPMQEAGAAKEKLYTYIEKQERKKADYELNRLLYVACTRAKKRLYLHADVKSNTDTGAISVQAGSFLASLWPHLNTTAPDFFQESPALSTHHDTPPERRIKRLPQAMFMQTNPRTPAMPSTQQRQGFALPDSRAERLGTITHRLLQKIGNEGLKAWPENAEAQTQLIQALMRLYQWRSADAQEAITTIQTMINRVLNTEQGRWCLSPHKEAASEFAITLLEAGKPSQLIIDRTFVDADENRWIIDYKTTPMHDKNINAFIKAETEKHQAQMQRYLSAMQAIESRPIKLGLLFIAEASFVDISHGF